MLIDKINIDFACKVKVLVWKIKQNREKIYEKP